jgi:hypothetical protein
MKNIDMPSERVFSAKVHADNGEYFTLTEILEITRDHAWPGADYRISTYGVMRPRISSITLFTPTAPVPSDVVDSWAGHR